MLENLKHCPLCNSGQFSKYMTCQDYTVSNEQFDMVQCNKCDLLFTNPRPISDDLYQYYKSEDYISHSNKSNNPINWVYKIARSFTLRRKVKLINSVCTKGDLLDIGCGTGHFISASQKDGWNISGVEPDAEARKIATEKTEINIVSDITEITDKKFDLITMWHVLEHIPNIDEFMYALFEKVKAKGKLIVAVPNYKSYDASHYKQYWAAYDLPRHLYHFEQKTLESLVNKYGLTLTKTLPMTLDSYYVSLLSEGYKGSGLLKYITAPYIGLKSNRYAQKNHNNFSSLIYIISK